MPEKETIKTVPQKPQAIEEYHLPQCPSVQVPEAVDQNADERYVHEVEYDHADNTGDIGERAFEDLTDRENDEFIYVY